MFERFTDKARLVIVNAQNAARELNHNYIGTEHLLIGLMETEGISSNVLQSMGVNASEVVNQVREIIGVGQRAPAGHIPFTPRSRKVLELSLREALQLGYAYIGTEHLLLGLIREGDGVAAQVLVKLGVDLNQTRAAVIKAMHGTPDPDSVIQRLMKSSEDLRASADTLKEGIKARPIELTAVQRVVQRRVFELDLNIVHLEQDVDAANLKLQRAADALQMARKELTELKGELPS